MSAAWPIFITQPEKCAWIFINDLGEVSGRAFYIHLQPSHHRVYIIVKTAGTACCPSDAAPSPQVTATYMCIPSCGLLDADPNQSKPISLGLADSLVLSSGTVLILLRLLPYRIYSSRAGRSHYRTLNVGYLLEISLGYLPTPAVSLPGGAFLDNPSWPKLTGRSRVWKTKKQHPWRENSGKIGRPQQSVMFGTRKSLTATWIQHFWNGTFKGETCTGATTMPRPRHVRNANYMITVWQFKSY